MVTAPLRICTESTLTLHKHSHRQGNATRPQRFDKDPVRVTAKLVQASYPVIDVACPASDNHRPSFMHESDGWHPLCSVARCMCSVVSGSGLLSKWMCMVTCLYHGIINSGMFHNPLASLSYSGDRRVRTNATGERNRLCVGLFM